MILSFFAGTQGAAASGDIGEMPPSPPGWNVPNATKMPAKSSSLYGGIGFTLLGDPKEIEMSAQEASLLSNEIYGGKNEVKTKRLAKDIFLGYKLPLKGWAIEVGYIGGDTGARSSTTGSYNWRDMNGDPASTSFYYSQKSVVSAWHLSFIKELPLNEYVKVFGRFGGIKTHTEWEQKWRYVALCTGCTNDGTYQAKSKTTDKTGALFGVGLSANLFKNIDMRFEVTRHSSLYEPKIGAVMSF